MADPLDAAPDDPLTIFGQQIQAALPEGIAVVVGVDEKASTRRHPRIVIYPDEGAYEAPGDNVASIADIRLDCVAALWAGSHKKAWYLRTLFFRAIEAQQSAVDEDDNDVSLFWERNDEKWDTGPDTTIDGVGLEIRFRVRVSVDRADPTLGLVQTTTIQQEP